MAPVFARFGRRRKKPLDACQFGKPAPPLRCHRDPYQTSEAAPLAMQL